MCLTKINEQYDQPSNVVISGAKVFGGSKSKPVFQAQGGYVPLDQWIKAGGKEIPADDGLKYFAGFHVYEVDQKLSGERRVYIRKVHTRGMQDGKVVLVADEMYVPSNPNSWPPKASDENKTMLDKMKDLIVGPGGQA